MTNQTNLITGISGFIAGNLANALLAQGQSVVGAGRQKPAAWVSGNCEFALLDITNFDQTVAVLQKVKPHTVYHLAAHSILTGGENGGAKAMLDTNVSGTTHILEAARHAEIPVVIVASSDKQYGALAVPPYDDNDTTAFLNGGLYELSKAQSDQIARLYAGLYDTPSVRVARLVNIYGPGDTHWSRIVPGNIRRALQNQRPRLTSGPAGEAVREYLFVDDAVVALQALAHDAHQTGNVPHRRGDGKLARVAVNIASPHRATAAQMIAEIAVVLQTFGVTASKPEINAANPDVFQPGHQFNQSERLQTLLPRWNPLPIADGLHKTVPWYLSNLPTG
jgi:nucleoside-diphosphate-sugar epimerase